jgi:hypothetical protein
MSRGTFDPSPAENRRVEALDATLTQPGRTCGKVAPANPASFAGCRVTAPAIPGYADACGAAHCASARSPSASDGGVGISGVSRKYHSASSAAWQPEPAAVIAWR